MTYRDELIERTADVLSGQPIGHGYYQSSIGRGEAQEIAVSVVDAVLPQIHTVEELDALRSRESGKTLLIDREGCPYLLKSVSNGVVELIGPLTIVWQPS